MKLESQVVSLELAKRLKELGVSQESAFYFVLTDAIKKEHSILGCGLSFYEKGNLYTVDDYHREAVCSAFTVAELGEMLPNEINFKGSHQCVLVIGKPFDWQISYRAGGGSFVIKETADTEANARAKMLIYLIEQGIVKP